MQLRISTCFFSGALAGVLISSSGLICTNSLSGLMSGNYNFHINKNEINAPFQYLTFLNEIGTPIISVVEKNNNTLKNKIKLESKY